MVFHLEPEEKRTRGKGMKKTCSKCKAEKDIGEFGVDRSQEGGRQSRCRECQSIYAEQRRRIRVEKEEEDFNTKVAVSDMVFLRNMKLLVKAYNQIKRKSRSVQNFRFMFKAK